MLFLCDNGRMQEGLNVADLSTKWIENLALEEINMDESGVIHVEDHLNPHHMLEESSIELMNTLKDHFEFYVTKFNEYRGTRQGGSEIKIFKISNTVNDFMLFRNGIRLIFARKADDLISIGFISGGKDFFGSRLSKNETIGNSPLHELKAHIGPFNQISWRFKGETVSIIPMLKHYLSEFIRISAR